MTKETILPANPEPQDKKTLAITSWEGFLKSCPPHTERIVKGLTTPNLASFLNTPRVRLYCDFQECSGDTYHSYDGRQIQLWLGCSAIIKYQCDNCRNRLKVFAIHFGRIESYDCEVMKLGQIPAFGPLVPRKLYKLLDSDGETFRKGLRCESHGLGIGAFSYYRRIVDNQWKHLIEEIIKACNKDEVSKGKIEQLEKARDEQQFSRAVTDAKDAIPETLMIKTHNPLTLLYNATSVGIHGLSDGECLERANSIRIVLAELAKRISDINKDDDALKKAIADLHRKE